MEVKKIVLVAVGVVILAVAVILAQSLFRARLAPPPEAEGITLYVITRHDTVIQEKSRTAFLASDLAKQYNIADIRFLPAAPAMWESYIKEGVVDVAWGGGPTLFDFLARKGLLEPITSDVALSAMAKIPDDIGGVPMKRFDEQGRVLWVAAAISSFGFTVNHDSLENWKLPKPSSWKDLASNVFGMLLPVTQVGIADPTRSTSNTRIYEIIIQAYGWEEGWRTLMLMAANAKVFDSSDAVREAVRTGDIAVGITIDFYGYTLMMENPRTEYIVPPAESILNGDPIALAKGTKHPEAAQAFIAWVLSAEGQKVWLDPKINRMPISPEVFDTPEGQKRQDLKKLYELTLQSSGIEFSDERALAVERALQEYFKAAFVDINQDLKRAWQAVLALKEKDPAKYEELKKKLTDLLTITDPLTGQKVKFTEEYAAKINPKLEDPEILAKFRDAVREAALARYNEILALAAGG